MTQPAGTPQGGFPLWAFLAIIAAMLLAHFAFGAPPAGSDPNSPMAAWYRSLKTPEGGSCCSEADCRPAEARLRDGGWEILAEDPARGVPVWERVPDERVLRRENLDGRPIACRFAGRTLCFIPPSGV